VGENLKLKILKDYALSSGCSRIVLYRVGCALVHICVLAWWLAALCVAQEPNSKASAPSPKSEQIDVNWLYGAYVPKDAPLLPLTGDARLKLYVAQSFTTPGIYIKSALFSLGDQMNGRPPEWGGGIGGYSQRFASRYGQSLIQNTLSASGNALLKYEPRYDRCRCMGFWPRTRHAFIRNFVTYNRTEKNHRPQLALYAGALGSGAISTTWLPGKQNPWVEGYQAMISQAVWGLATNWAGEFAPEIVRVIKRKKN
jgi:hypothetical protein